MIHRRPVSRTLHYKLALPCFCSLAAIDSAAKRSRMKPAVSVLVVVLFASLVARPQPQAKPEDLARQAAESWLTLVDAGRFGDSWNQAAQVFKLQIKKGQWENTARA